MDIRISRIVPKTINLNIVPEFLATSSLDRTVLLLMLFSAERGERDKEKKKGKRRFSPVVGRYRYIL
jgi:hypothetical protein